MIRTTGNIIQFFNFLQKTAVVDTKDADKELYSEEEEEDEEDEEEEDIEEPVKEVVQKKTPPVAETKPTEESEPEDVEIIDDEQIEEELEDEEDEDEEEISDVDDTELLSRLEAKYGRMPEPERYGSKPERFGPIHSKQNLLECSFLWKDYNAGMILVVN